MRTPQGEQLTEANVRAMLSGGDLPDEVVADIMGRVPWRDHNGRRTITPAMLDAMLATESDKHGFYARVGEAKVRFLTEVVRLLPDETTAVGEFFTTAELNAIWDRVSGGLPRSYADWHRSES